MSDRKALVTGASGFLGRALVDRLVSRGQPVVALTRRSTNTFPSGVEVITGDLMTGQGISAAIFTDVSHVFHCAGEVSRVGTMQQLHVEGTRQLLACVPQMAAGGAVLRWVHLSSVGAYGPPAIAGERRTIDEQSPERPSGEYERTKTASDDLVRRLPADGRVSWVIVRPSGVIGAQMSNQSLRGVIAMIERGWFFHIGPADAIATYVHVDDVVTAMVTCSVLERAAGQVFNVSSDCRWQDLVDYVARECGVRPPRIRLSESAVRMGVRVAGNFMRLPLTAPRIDALVNRTSYPAAKIQSMLGYGFARPMPEAIEDLIPQAKP